eukprot:3022548-Amphidinium_carterae.1
MTFRTRQKSVALVTCPVRTIAVTCLEPLTITAAWATSKSLTKVDSPPDMYLNVANMHLHKSKNTVLNGDTSSSPIESGNLDPVMFNWVVSTKLLSDVRLLRLYLRHSGGTTNKKPVFGFGLKA